MAARLSAFVIWALVSGAAVFWLSRLWASPLATPAHAATVSTTAAARGDLTRLLGAPVVAAAPSVAVPDAAARFKLIGVMAPRGSSLPAAGAVAGSVPLGPGTEQGQGVALIAVDGKPPRPYRVGAAIENEFILQAVAPRAVSIRLASTPTAAPIRLELPPLPPPATGQLPAVSFNTLSAGPGGVAAMPPAATVVPPTAVNLPGAGNPAAPVATDPNAPPPGMNLPGGIPNGQAR